MKFREMHSRHGISSLVWTSLFLILTLRVFRYFPGEYLLAEFWFAVCALFVLGPYLWAQSKRGWKFTGYELYVLFLIGAIPVIASITANQVFGQPVIVGLGTQRGIVLATGALYIMYAYRKNKLNVGDLERGFIFLAWLTLIVYSNMTILLDPSLMDEEGSFVKGGIIEEAHFNFDPVFIIFGIIYYVNKGYLANKARYYYMALPFVLYLLIIDGGRAKIVALLMSLIVMVIIKGSSSKKLQFGLYFLTILSFAMMFVFVYDFGYLVGKYEKFMDAFDVLFFHETGNDVSANQRVYESAIAWPYVMKYWLFGVGTVSPQWSGGYSGIMGAHFYPSDIGLLGIIFVYGLFGALVYALQFVYGLSGLRGIYKLAEYRYFTAGSIGFLLFDGFYSIFSGYFVYNIQVGLIMIAALYCVKSEGMSK